MVGLAPIKKGGQVIKPIIIVKMIQVDKVANFLATCTVDIKVFDRTYLCNAASDWPRTFYAQGVSVYKKLRRYISVESIRLTV